MTHTIQFRRGRAKVEFDLPDLPFAGNAFIPSMAVIPLVQDSDDEATPIVSVGDHVREGQLIARGSVPVHAPIPGVVSAFRRIPLPNGSIGEAAVISLRGSFSITGRKSANNDWRSIPPGDVCKIVDERGVVNSFEGAHSLAKDIRRSRAIEKPVLVCRLFDSDPTSPVESLTLKECGPSVWNGFGILAAAMKAHAIVLAFEEGGASAVPAEDTLRGLFGEARVSAISVKPRYPGGSAYRLSKLIRERVSDLSLSNAVFCDAVTALAAYEAVVRDLPSITMNVLVAGSAIAAPRFLRVRTGTLIGDIIDECGGFRSSPARIIVNGLIRGTALYDLDTPITRYTRSLHVMDKDSCPSFTVQSCTHCGACLGVCPSRLDPIGTVIAVRNRSLSVRDIQSIHACEQCGCCSMVCPARIPIHHEIAVGRQLSKEGAQRD